jgi:hypothetical protein
MTRERIAEGLSMLVLGLANPGTLMDPPDDWTAHEWAYVKGLASGAILRLRDAIVVIALEPDAVVVALSPDAVAVPRATVSDVPGRSQT